MLSALTYTIIEAPAHGWTSTETLGGFALSAVVLLGVRGRRAAQPPTRCST